MGYIINTHLGWLTQSGGYVGFIPKNYTNSPVIIGFQTGVLSSNFRHQFYDYLVSNQVKEVIYNPNTTFQSVVNIIKSYHWQTKIIGHNVIVYSVGGLIASQAANDPPTAALTPSITYHGTSVIKPNLSP